MFSVCRRGKFICSQVPPARWHNLECNRPCLTFEANGDAGHRKKVVDEPILAVAPSRLAELASPAHAVGQEIPQPMDTPDHLDVAVEELGVTGGAGQYDCPAANEFAGGVEGFFERAPPGESRISVMGSGSAALPVRVCLSSTTLASTPHAS